MIQANEIEYTDFIQFQETETFTDGIASSKQEVRLFFDDRVDLESSLVIYDGQNIDLISNPSIQIQKEGISELIYILKDIDGYPLEEGKKDIILDTTLPIIDMKYHDDSVLDTIILDCKDTIHVDIQDENLTEYEVYVNEEKLDISDPKFDIELDKNTKSIRISCKDIAQNTLERNIGIQYIEYPIISSFDTIYLSDNSYVFNVNTYQEDFDLEVYRDGIYFKSIPIENSNSLSLTFDGDGVYTFCLKHRKYDHLKKEIKGILIYSNVEPFIQLLPSSIYTNQDVNVGVEYQCDYLNSGFIEIAYNGMIEKYPLMKNIFLPKKLGLDIVYDVSAYILDEFGRSASSKVQVKIDNKVPNTNLYVNDQLYTNPLEIIEMPRYFFEKDEQNATMNIQYYLNEEFKEGSFETIFKNMKKDDVLKILTTTTDLANNKEVKEYQFVFKPKPIKIVSTITTQNKEDHIEYERVWSMDELNQIKLEDKVSIVDQTRPKIHYSRDKDIVHIWIDQNEDYSKDFFESIQINGENVDLSKVKKDKLNNDSIDIKLKSKVSDIVVKAKDENGNETVLKKSEIKNWTALSIGMFVGALCILIYVLLHRL